MIQINNHIHTKFSDGINTVQEMIDAAKASGLKIITFTDHFQSPILDKFIEFDAVVKMDTLDKYKETVRLAKKEGMKVLTGLEIDHMPKAKKEIKEIISKAKLDFALGGVHNTQPWSIDYTDELYEKSINVHGGMNELYKVYYSYVLDMIKSGIYDCVAHLDIIKVFNVTNRYFKENEEEYIQLVNECIKSIKKAKMCIELNTGGFRTPIKTYFPSKWIIEQCFENGIELTLGSDAHRANMVTSHYDTAEKVLREIGYEKLVYFENRKKKYVDL